MSPEDKADLKGDIQRADETDTERRASRRPPSPMVPRNQVLKLVEQALRSQSDPGAYTQRAFRDLVSDRTGAVTRGIEPMHEWKKRALSLVLACLDTSDLPLQRDERMNPLPAPPDIQSPDIQSLTTCRDHWKTSFEHERANVIRLRSLLLRAHQSMSEGGLQCDCRDCHMFRHGGNQPPKTSQAIAQGDRTCSACGRLVAPPEMMTRFSETVNLCSACL